MSLENLLRIRPRGVVSKNAMGERRMLFSMRLWIVAEALMLPMARAKDPIQMKRAWKMPRPAYTPRNSSLEKKKKKKKKHSQKCLC